VTRRAPAGRRSDEALSDPEDDHVARLSLVCLENTHNRAGGVIVPLERLRATAAAAHAHGLRFISTARVCGTRVLRPASRSRSGLRDGHGDDVLLEGLGAPIGSILAGPAPVVARRGGCASCGAADATGGHLAAACLYALDHHVRGSR
jgi:threonine aldolase